MPLAVADPAWDVGRHCGLCLTWMTREEERKKEVSGGWEVGHRMGVRIGTAMREGKMEGRGKEMSGGNGSNVRSELGI